MDVRVFWCHFCSFCPSCVRFDHSGGQQNSLSAVTHHHAEVLGVDELQLCVSTQQAADRPACGRSSSRAVQVRQSTSVLVVMRSANPGPDVVLLCSSWVWLQIRTEQQVMITGAVALVEGGVKPAGWRCREQQSVPVSASALIRLLILSGTQQAVRGSNPAAGATDPFVLNWPALI